MRVPPNEIMPLIHQIVDQYVASKSSFYEAAIRPYLPELSAYMLNQLAAKGYYIEKPDRPGRAIHRIKRR